MKSRAVVAWAAVVALASCSSNPHGSGETIRVTILDANRILLNGDEASWEQLDAHARAVVKRARESESGKPHVYVDAMATVAAKQTNRMVDLLAAAGIRSIEFLPIRR